MAEPKTKVTKKSVRAFLMDIKDAEQRADSLKLLKLMEGITKEKAKLWGTSIVGFGMYHYTSERSAQEGDWMRTGFSPRKGNLSIYIIPGFQKSQQLLKRLGKHKTSVSCLYVRRLSDIDLAVLREIIHEEYQEMEKRYPTKKRA